ncbi:hypothetical protein IU405_04095, partial [Polaribacter sp. BAL334]|nr:hypothetical protein [Polaribacter sp. BAL334]
MGSKVKGIDADTFGTTLTFSNLDFVTTDALSTISTQLTSTHAEILADQTPGTGANTCVFSGWTAYFTKDANLCSSSNIGSGTVFFITSDTNWSGTVNIDGKVVVNNNATLTIQPGTVIKAAFKSDPVDASALVVAKGAKIIANGTAALPIVFTAAADPLTAANVAAGVYVAPGHDLDLNGLWGGVIILG